MTFIPVLTTGEAFGGGSYGGGAYGGYNLVPWISVEVDVTNSPRNPTRVWTDITTLCRSISSSRSGRNDEVQRTNPGSISILADNRREALTGLGIRKSQWIRYRAQWNGTIYARWQGIIDSLPRQWPSSGKDDVYQITGTDVLKILRLYDLADETFPAQRNDERVSSLVSLASLSAGSIDTGTDSADAVVTPISAGTDALSTALTIEESENGLLVAEPDGTVSFQGRHWRSFNSASSLATFGESSSSIPYSDNVVLEDDDSRIANIVGVTPLGGTAVVVEDTASQDEHWPRRFDRTLVTSDSSIATDAANYLLSRYKDPSPRLPAIEVSLAATALRDPALVATLLAAGNSDRFTWTRAATTPITDDVYVEQISETISPGNGWSLQVQLSPAGDESGWVLGDSVLGVLGSTTRLVY